MWLRHNGELQALVNGNRRVALSWHRSGGPALMQQMVRAADRGTFTLPTEIHGRAVDDCVAEVAATFARHGSAELRRDIGAWRELLPPLAGKNYDELVASLSPSPSETSR
jgi:hypothetical protein